MGTRKQNRVGLEFRLSHRSREDATRVSALLRQPREWPTASLEWHTLSVFAVPTYRKGRDRMGHPFSWWYRGELTSKGQRPGVTTVRALAEKLAEDAA
jgi:hypothetical protein